jgi:hypothetical protein
VFGWGHSQIILGPLFPSPWGLTLHIHNNLTLFHDWKVLAQGGPIWLALPHVRKLVQWEIMLWYIKYCYTMSLNQGFFFLVCGVSPKRGGRVSASRQHGANRVKYNGRLCYDVWNIVTPRVLTRVFLVCGVSPKWGQQRVSASRQHGANLVKDIISRGLQLIILGSGFEKCMRRELGHRSSSNWVGNEKWIECDSVVRANKEVKAKQVLHALYSSFWKAY